jgi:hypothetical protein
VPRPCPAVADAGRARQAWRRGHQLRRLGDTYFSHADGNRYGVPQPDPARSKVLAEVFQILASMGFRQREARQMLDEGSPHVRADMGVQEALRTVLRSARVSCVAERIEPSGEQGAWSGACGSRLLEPVAVRTYC